MKSVIMDEVDQNNNQNQERMDSEQLNKPLMNTAVLEIQKEGEGGESTFIERYNSVVNCYNRHAEEDRPKMQVIVGNRFIYTMGSLLSFPAVNILLALTLLFVPVFNYICFCSLLVYLYYLKRQNRKHLRNLTRVRDPFESFYFMQEMCENLGKHFAVINLTHKELQGFTFNQELREKLAQKLKERSSKKEEQMTVLIYDQYFYDSFYLYRQEFFKTLIWACFGVVQVVISTAVYLKVFGFI